MLVRWLMEEHFCPIRKIRTGNNRKNRGTDVPVMTSKGRTVLSIAMDGLRVDILRYLVVDRNVSIFQVKDLETSLRALEAVLLNLPPPQSMSGDFDAEARAHEPRWDEGDYSGDDMSAGYSSLGEDLTVGAGDASTIISRRSEAATEVVSE